MPELINQPFQVVKWWPQCLVVCHCKREQGILNIINLTGLQNRTICESCGKSYYIVGFVPDPQGPKMVVQFDLPPVGVM